MDAAQAHTYLEDFCKGNAGIGISIDVVEALFEDQLQLAATHAKNLLSNQKFEGLDIEIDATFDNKTATLDFHEVVDASSGHITPGVKIESLQVLLDVRLDGIPIAKIELSYKQIVGRIQFVDRIINIASSSDKHQLNGLEQLWLTVPATKDLFAKSHGFTDVTWENLLIHLRGIVLFGGSEIGRSVIESLEFPDLLDMFVGVEFGSDTRLKVETGLLLLTATTTSLILDNCPTRPVNGGINTRTTARVGERSVQIEVNSIGDLVQREGEETTVDVSVGGDACHQCQYDGGEMEELETADIFLFTPVDLLKINFDGVLKPSVTAAERKRHGPFFTHYALTAALKGIGLRLANSWPIEFELSAPLFVHGQAGAGIKIGSIWHEVAGIAFTGDVDPLDIRFRIWLDYRRSEIVFDSRIHRIVGTNFRFTSSLPWPLSDVAGWILGGAAEKLIKDQAGKVLSITRIPIANFGLLSGLGEIMNGLAGATDADGNATMGVKLHRP